MKICLVFVLISAGTLVQVGHGRDFSPFLKDLDKAIRNEISREKHAVDDDWAPLSACSCGKGSCSCCVHLQVQSIKLQVCGNATFESNASYVNFTLSVNGLTFLTEKISGDNPPPICKHDPKYQQYQVCVDFKNVSFDIKEHMFSGCANLQLKMGMVIIQEALLGCFKVQQQLRYALLKKFMDDTFDLDL